MRTTDLQTTKVISFEDLRFLKHQLQSKEMKLMKLTQNDVSFLTNYCKLLNYSLSINDQLQTAKVFNKATNKWGYIQKIEKVFYYGYFKKDPNGNSFFIKKYPLTDNFTIFSYFVQLNPIKVLDQQKWGDFLYGTCGIIDLGISDKSEN